MCIGMVKGSWAVCIWRQPARINEVKNWFSSSFCRQRFEAILKQIFHISAPLPSFLTWLYWLGHRLLFRENRIAETNLSPFGFGSFLDFGFQTKGSAKFVYYPWFSLLCAKPVAALKRIHLISRNKDVVFLKFIMLYFSLFWIAKHWS